MRAVYNPGTHPALPFRRLVGNALAALPVAGDTEIPIASLGVVAIRHRSTPRPGVIRLAMGAGAPGEAMSTMGLGVDDAEDSDQANAPPRHRAYKLADAYCLLEGGEMLVMVDGMRLGAVAQFLRQLLQKADQPAPHSAFELHPVSDPDKEQVLAQEGVRALKLLGTAHAAEDPDALDGEIANDSPIHSAWSTFLTGLRDVFTEEAGSEGERRSLAEHWDQLKVSTTIRAKGGSRADEAVLNSLGNVSADLIEDAPHGLDIQVITGKGSKVSPSELVLGKYVNLTRQERRNDLNMMDVWAELDAYRLELRQQGRWNP